MVPSMVAVRLPVAVHQTPRHNSSASFVAATSLRRFADDTRNSRGKELPLQNAMQLHIQHECLAKALSVVQQQQQVRAKTNGETHDVKSSMTVPTAQPSIFPFGLNSLPGVNPHLAQMMQQLQQQQLTDKLNAAQGKWQHKNTISKNSPFTARSLPLTPDTSPPTLSAQARTPKASTSTTANCDFDAQCSHCNANKVRARATTLKDCNDNCFQPRVAALCQQVSDLQSENSRLSEENTQTKEDMQRIKATIAEVR